MTAPGTLLAAAAGGLGGGGACCLAAWTRGTAARPPGPPPRWRAAAARLRVSRRTGVLAAAAGLAVLAVTRWPVAGIAAVPAVIFLPRILSRRPAQARIARLEALESWTRRLADVLAGGRGLEDALTHSAASAPDPVAGPVRELAGALRSGSAAAPAIRRLADQLDDPVGDLIATALLLAADRRGPGVRAVLAELAGDVAGDVASQREIEAERASYRTALTWIVGFLLAYTVFLVARHSYSAPFGTAAGQGVLAAAAACYGSGMYWLHRLARAGGPGRFLHGQAGQDPAAAAERAR